MHLIRHTSRILLGLILLAFGACCVFVAYYLFSGAHFIVTDGVGDQREMQDFAVSTPYWLDVLRYLPFYLPSLIAGLVGLVFSGLGGGLLLRVSKPDSRAAANP
jgi:hypothetical protein